MNPPNRSAVAARFPLLAVALGMLATVPAGASDFRGVSWGATPDEVRQVERHALHHEQEDELAYWGFEFAGVEAGLVYEFEAGALVRARFESRNAASDPEEHFADYEAFKRQNAEHFGDPGVEEWIWADGADHPESDRSAAAITAGRARLETRWVLDTARATLLIAGSDGEIKTVRVSFEPKR